jgi:two-component system cell cycle sensor histidine kinase/response regulator CckA
MTMPNITGDQLAKKFMAIRQDIPVILCTGFSTRITEEKAKDMGIRAFISKPILKQDMAETIRKVLDET